MAVHDCYGFVFSVKQVSLPASPEFMMTVGDPQPGSGGAMGGGGGGIGADISTAGRGGGGGGGAGACAHAGLEGQRSSRLTLINTRPAAFDHKSFSHVCLLLSLL